MKFIAVPNRYQPMPQGSDMRPLHDASVRGQPIFIAAGTCGSDLLGDIGLDSVLANPHTRPYIEAFTRKVFIVPVQTEVRLIPFGSNYFVSLKAVLKQIRCKNQAPGRLEHVLAYGQGGCYRTGSACRKIPAFTWLRRDGRTDLTEFLYLDECKHSLEIGRLKFNEISNQISVYLPLAVTATE